MNSDDLIVGRYKIPINNTSKESKMDNNFTVWQEGNKYFMSINDTPREEVTLEYIEQFVEEHDTVLTKLDMDWGGKLE